MWQYLTGLVTLLLMVLGVAVHAQEPLHPSGEYGHPRGRDGIQFRVPPPSAPDEPREEEITVVEEVAQRTVDSSYIPGPLEFFLLDENAVPLNLDTVKVAIGYPLEAKKMEIQGKVIVRVLVGPSGNYVRHVVIKDPHPQLTAHVEAHLAELEFRAARLKGKSVYSWYTIPFDFRLVK